MHTEARLCSLLVLLCWLNVSSPDIRPCLQPIFTSPLINPDSINVHYLNIVLCVCGVVRGGRPAGWMMINDTQWNASSNRQDLLLLVEKVAEKLWQKILKTETLKNTYNPQHRELFSPQSGLHVSGLLRQKPRHTKELGNFVQWGNSDIWQEVANLIRKTLLFYFQLNWIGEQWEKKQAASRE